ncbi:hypothetical protein F4804DRAFT_306074 [Jackrogersella minutella]|nr:hypothetical protein F4804DRAFT_306074 [Jackrogersella minutella]
MAGSLAALKSLPCPAGDQCTAFQCLFKHDNDANPATSSKLADDALTQDSIAPSSNQLLPRKRVKLDSTTSTPSYSQPTPQETMSLQSELISKKDPTSPLAVDRKRRFSVGQANQGCDDQAGDTQSEDAQSVVTRREKSQGEGYQGTGINLKQTTRAERTVAAGKLREAKLGEIQSRSTPASSTSMSQAPKASSSTIIPHNDSINPSSIQSRNSSTPLSTAQAHNSSKPIIKSAPKEPEALNPRLLKKSPAQHGTRLKLINALHEQYIRLNSELKKDDDKMSKQLVLSDQELVVKVLDDEQEVAIKKFAIYGNVIRNKIMAYKRMTVSKWKEERMLATKAGDSQTAPIPQDSPHPIDTGLTPLQEVDFLPRLVWPFEGLANYGYVSQVPSDDDIKKARASVEASGNVEMCDRCTRRFQVFPGRREEDGALASNGTCTYHPGKVYYTERGPGKLSQATKKYRCCHQNVNDDTGGCATAPTHVFKTTDINRLASLLNFCETPPNPTVPADRAVCFDCEMGFSVYGLELIRLTVVSWPSYETLIDILVQPFGEVLDLNTRYSGVTPEDMATAERWFPGQDHKPTTPSPTDTTNPHGHVQKPKLKIASDPRAARDLFFSVISPETPLIGHGLENDLNSIRVIHPTCVDTILLYPHKRGLPHRNGLRMLMETLLNKKIQQEADETAPEGHDSAEDAKAAGELVRLKVRDEWKSLQLKGWTIQDGKIAAPDDEWTVVGGSKNKRRAA